MAAYPHSNTAARGYRILYHTGATNYCPGCGHTNWYVGRWTAECAFCATVLPLSDRQGQGDYALAS
jgi:hypothetical protein